MSVTRQEPPPHADRGGGAGGGSAAGREGSAAAAPGPVPAMPFDVFLKLLHSDAKARNDTEWLEWYAEWLGNMPEDGREAYIEKSRIDYERRTGVAVGKYFARQLDGITDRDIKRRIDRDIKRRIDRDIKRRIDRNTERCLARNTERCLARDIDRRTKRNLEKALDKQIMVDNFEDFQREYIEMMIRRCC